MFEAMRRPNPVFGDEYAELRGTLVTARLNAGISQRELASRLGKCASHVAKIERGQRRVDTLEFYQIAASLGVEPVALFEDFALRLRGTESSSDEPARFADQRARA